MKITQQYIIITGAASGIGKETLQLLAHYDCYIIATDIKKELLEKTVLELGYTEAKIDIFAADVSIPEEIDKLFEYALAKFPQVDIFIANAGFAYYERLIQADWQHIEKIFALNVFSPIYSLLKMKQTCQGRKYYVCITASAMAKMGLAGYALYGSTKAALDRFADAYQFEKEDKGILGLVYPIATKTNFFSGAGNAPIFFPSQEPQKVAKAIVKGILREKRHIYPSSLFVFSYLLGFLQNLLNRPYQKYAQKVFRKYILRNID
jgi:short-subunit dehydrogenase